MNTKYHTLVFGALAVFIFMSCGGEKKTATKPSASENTSAQAFTVPAVPNEIMQKLYTQATYVDYIFYNLPFSLSQDNAPSIQANLNLIGREPLGSIPQKCKPVGREFFQINGEVAYEADLYFSEGCYGYVFLQDEKPIYANKISDEGIKFYQKIFDQANQVRNQAIQNGQ